MTPETWEGQSNVCNECEGEFSGFGVLCPFCGCCGRCCNCPDEDPEEDL